MNPPQVPTTYIEALPDDILRKSLGMLPASHRFVAPVSIRFRNLYGAAVEKNRQNHTHKYSLSSEDALDVVLQEENSYLDFRVYYCVSRDQRLSRTGARCGRIDWVERGGVFDEKTCRAAALGGQLRVLQWLRAPDRQSWDDRNGSLCTWASEGGHLEVLQWLREKRSDWGAHTCSTAARYGHLAVLRWSRAKGCAWDSSTCWWAAFGGHLEVLRWLREEGCEWDLHTCTMAAKAGHLDVLRWAIENGCNYYEEHFQIITDTKFLEWFKNHKTVF